jgi:GNAT superfamily N-acetyltransferase
MASAMANSDPPIGRLAVSELPDAGALVAEAGWNQVAADWRIFLEFGTVYAVRAGERVIATAATLPYGDTCAWISMVLVAGDHRRRGLATRLLRRCIDDVLAAGLVPVLDATPAGRTVYRPLGFEDAWGFQRLAAQEPRRDDLDDVTNIVVKSVDDSIWSQLRAYDTAASGVDRSAILGQMRGRLRGVDLIAIRDGRLAGFLLGRDGRVASHFGPLVADDDETARALLTHALRTASGPVFIDLADQKAAVREWLETRGFAPQRPFTRMLHGRSVGFDDGRRTYAVIGPEFG